MTKTRKMRSGSKRKGMSRRMKRSMSRKVKGGGACTCSIGTPTSDGKRCYKAGMNGRVEYYECDKPWWNLF